MGKFDGILLCTDLDGTLYSDDKTVSRENLDAIEYFKSEGGLFTFITGRPPVTAVDICKTIHPNAPYGCFNGGAIFDPAKNEYLWSMDLPRDAEELVAAILSLWLSVDYFWGGSVIYWHLHLGVL